MAVNEKNRQKPEEESRCEAFSDGASNCLQTRNAHVQHDACTRSQSAAAGPVGPGAAARAVWEPPPGEPLTWFMGLQVQMFLRSSSARKTREMLGKLFQGVCSPNGSLEWVDFALLRPPNHEKVSSTPHWALSRREVGGSWGGTPALLLFPGRLRSCFWFSLHSCNLITVSEQHFIFFVCLLSAGYFKQKTWKMSVNASLFFRNIFFNLDSDWNK